MMHAHFALVLALAAPALGAAAATARDRAGYQREIEASQYNQVPKLVDYIISDEFLASQKNRAKLVTKLRPEDAVASDNVILESNVVRIVKPAKRRTATDGGAGGVEGLVRRRRGYNLENVQVPARYPYLPVPQYNRFRRWG